MWGQEVWLSARDIPIRGGKCKLTPRYLGPFTIDWIISPIAVHLCLPLTMRRIHPTFHVSQLKPVVTHHLCPMSSIGGTLTLSTVSWTAVIGAVAFSMLWTGKATVPRRDPGPLPDLSWTRLLLGSFTRTTSYHQLERQEALVEGGVLSYFGIVHVCLFIVIYCFSYHNPSSCTLVILFHASHIPVILPCTHVFSPVTSTSSCPALYLFCIIYVMVRFGD